MGFATLQPYVGRPEHLHEALNCASSISFSRSKSDVHQSQSFVQIGARFALRISLTCLLCSGPRRGVGHPVSQVCGVAGRAGPATLPASDSALGLCSLGDSKPSVGTSVSTISHPNVVDAGPASSSGSLPEAAEPKRAAAAEPERAASCSCTGANVVALTAL